MKQFLRARKWGILFFLTVIAVNLAMAFEDTPSLTVNTGFNAVLLIPLLIGIIAHYLKSYSRGQTTVDIWQYMSQGVGTTIMTFIGSISVLIGMTAASPSAYSPVNFAVLFNVFLIGFSADSAIGGPAMKMTASVAAPVTTKPPTP